MIVPGYVLVALLFPRAGDIDGAERGGLALVLSACAVVVLALLLSELHIRMAAGSVAGATCLVVAALAAGAAVRREMLPASERYRLPWPWSRGFRLFLGTAVALAAITTEVVGANLSTRYVAFYVTGKHGHLQNCPYEIHVGQAFPVALHLSDPTPAALSGRVVEVGGRGHRYLDLAVSLAPGGRWSHPLLLPANAPLRREVVRFDFYRAGEAKPARELSLHYCPIFARGCAFARKTEARHLHRPQPPSFARVYVRRCRNSQMLRPGRSLAPVSSPILRWRGRYPRSFCPAVAQFRDV